MIRGGKLEHSRRCSELDAAEHLGCCCVQLGQAAGQGWRSSLRGLGWGCKVPSRVTAASAGRCHPLISRASGGFPVSATRDPMQGTRELKSVENALTRERSPSRHALPGRVMWQVVRSGFKQVRWEGQEWLKMVRSSRKEGEMIQEVECNRASSKHPTSVSFRGVFLGAEPTL